VKRFVLTPEARADLGAIWDFIAEDSFESADRVLEAFYRAFDQLAAMPGMGHKREDLTKHAFSQHLAPAAGVSGIDFRVFVLPIRRRQVKPDRFLYVSPGLSLGVPSRGTAR
jgi:plasmid stabilization system protein ParE